MGTELVRRAKALRLCKEILGNESRAEDLQRLISALESQSLHLEGLLKQEALLNHMSNPDSNLIPLRARKQKEPRSLTLFSKISDKRYLIQTPCLIEGQNHFERKKLGFEIHSRSHNHVFLCASSLSEDWSQDLGELNSCSLFISEISDISKEKQASLLGHLKNKTAPLILAASEFQFSELKNSIRVSKELLDEVMQAHFRLQRPVKEYLEMGFFKLFLESLR